jgi:hypothetical protein
MRRANTNRTAQQALNGTAPLPVDADAPRKALKEKA